MLLLLRLLGLILLDGDKFIVSEWWFVLVVLIP